MKKSIKFLAVFAFCFSVMVNYLPTYAAAPATVTCTACGRAASYSGSQEMGRAFRYDHEVTEGTCSVYSVYYSDMYRCGCGNVMQVSRNVWDEHSLTHK